MHRHRTIRRGAAAGFVLFLGWLVAPAVGAIELSRVVDAAVDADPSVASARAMLEASEQAVDVAAGRLRPQVTLQSTQQRLDQTTEARGGQSNFNGAARNTQITLRQGLVRPRDRGAVAIAEIQRMQAMHRVRIAVSEAGARAAAVWVDVLTARANLHARAEAVKTVRDMLAQAQGRLKAGDGTQDEVARLSGELADSVGQEQEAALDLKARLAVFAEVTRLPAAAFGEQALPDIGRLPRLPEWESDVWARVVTEHPEAAIALLDESIAERRLETARSDHWPTLDLIAGRTEAANDTTNTLGQRYRSSSVGLQLVVPIYTGGSLTAATGQATATRLAARAESDAVLQKLRNQLVGDWYAHRGLLARVDGAHGQVEAAEAQVSALRAHVKAGSRTLGDLAVAVQLVTRRMSERNALVGLYLKATARLVAQFSADSPVRSIWLRQLDAERPL